LPPGAPLALVLVGLLTKSGVFLNGLWLPRTHAEAPAEVSALLSGVALLGLIVWNTIFGYVLASCSQPWPSDDPRDPPPPPP